MGSTLEAGKLVAASWLYRNWQSCSVLLKTYLITAITILMIISSIGIFGYLSKSHIDQTASSSIGNSEQIAIIQNKIDTENLAVQDDKVKVGQIDSAIDNMIKNNRATSSLNAQNAQKKTRADLMADSAKHLQTIQALTEQKIKLDTVTKKAEADVGPLKYVAELIYQNASTDQIDKTVRYLIIIIVSVFDPLAVILLLAANTGFVNSKKSFTLVEKAVIVDKTKNALTIDETIFGEH